MSMRRSRRRESRFPSRILLASVLAVTLAACASDDTTPVGTATTSTTQPTTSTSDRHAFTPTTEAGVTHNVAKEIASDLDCEVVQEIYYEAYPRRGGAAVRGVTCTIGDATVDIFQRSRGEGGSLENIDHVVGTVREEQDACAWLLVGESWFLVTNTREVAVEAERTLRGVAREILPASPYISYEVPGGCRPA